MTHQSYWCGFHSTTALSPWLFVVPRNWTSGNLSNSAEIISNFDAKKALVWLGNSPDRVWWSQEISRLFFWRGEFLLLFRKVFVQAVFADGMTELRFRMLLDKIFKANPITFIVSDLFAIGADRQDAFEGLYFWERLLQLFILSWVSSASSMRLRFASFYTSKEVGKLSWQGLSVACQINHDKHYGNIWFEKEQGKGTTFTIENGLKGKQ